MPATDIVPRETSERVLRQVKPAAETAEQALAKYEPATLPAMMARHHPIHGLFGAAFEEIGGFARLKEWAGENYTDFLRIFAKMAPPPSADVTVRQMNIQINSQLQETPLDVAPE